MVSLDLHVSILIDPQFVQKLVNQNKTIAQKMSSGSLDEGFLSGILPANFRNFQKDLLIEIKSPITAIVGRNGTGKSTLLYLAACSYAPPIPEGQTKGTGKSFNDYIPESYKDKMPEKSEYGFRYGSNSKVHKFVWYSQRNEWDPRGRKRKKKSANSDSEENEQHEDEKRKRRPVYFIGAGKVISNIWWLSEGFGLSKNDEKKALNVIGKSTPEELRPGIVKKISDIAAKKYRKIYRRTDLNSEVCENCSGYIIDDNYSELASGAGEIAIVRMVDVIMRALNNSLIVIDEPEAGIHQLAQEKLLEFFIERAVHANLQFVFTTHSDFMLHGLTPDSIVLLTKSYDGRIKSAHLNNEQAFENISGRFNKKIEVMVEDPFAEKFLSTILDFDPVTKGLVSIRPANVHGWEPLAKREFLGQYLFFSEKLQLNRNSYNPKQVLVMDGDCKKNFHLQDFSIEFSTRQKRREFVNQNSLDSFIEKASGKLGGRKCRFQIRFFTKNKNLSDLDKAELLFEYIDYLLQNHTFLPGNQSPEIIIYEWLRKALKAGSVNESILRHVNNKSEFTSIYSEQYTSSSEKDFYKNKISLLSEYNSSGLDLLSMVLNCWVTDPENNGCIAEITKKFSEWIDQQ